MVDPAVTRRWGYRALFMLAVGAAVFLALLPLSLTPSRLPGPDLLLCVAYAWLLRRPEDVPAVLLAAVFLVSDMLYMRPPGLWSALALLGSEVLRRRQPALRDLSFPAEWAMVAAIMAAVMVGHYLALGLARLAQPGLGLVALQSAVTLLAYPAVVLVLRTAPGVRLRRARESSTERGR